jgi:hypothetical protein
MNNIVVLVSKVLNYMPNVNDHRGRFEFNFLIRKE